MVLSRETVTADADLPIDGSEVYLIPVVGTDGLFRPGPGLQRAADTDGPFETHLWNYTHCVTKLVRRMEMASWPDIFCTLCDLHCATHITVMPRRCQGRSCMLSPNFVLVVGAKVNTASMRSFTMATGIDWVTKETFADKSEGGYGKEFCD